MFMEQMDFRRSESLINLPPVDLTILTEIMSGHCRLNSHLYKIRKISDPSCPYCGKLQNQLHTSYVSDKVLVGSERMSLDETCCHLPI